MKLLLNLKPIKFPEDADLKCSGLLICEVDDFKQFFKAKLDAIDYDKACTDEKTCTGKNKKAKCCISINSLIEKN